ncbi:hypothetical protein NDU88_005213 [Pleurodeles waltl]|uniref:Secreted protein n=1 Tax=Pleurodeles waltl TaxID=8319 RepID=A0AAV7WA31_PLEWA|nr:hypothetical protein NDU88_005213 [Pleurodeles waltl]
MVPLSRSVWRAVFIMYAGAGRVHRSPSPDKVERDGWVVRGRHGCWRAKQYLRLRLHGAWVLCTAGLPRRQCRVGLSS